MSFVRWIATAAFLLIVGAAQAGTIHPALQAEMDQTAADTPISAIVYLAEQAPIALMDQNLREANATRRERHRQVVEALQATARSTQGRLQAYLDDRMMGGQVEGYSTHWISNLIIVYATKAELAELAAHPDVDVIERNFTATLIEPIASAPPGLDDADETGGMRGIGVTPGLYACRAPEAWALGFTGAGRVVANLDTGVDGNHPALGYRWRGNEHPWQECWLDVLGGSTQFPSDTYGHGTHVMGTECGRADATGDTVGISYDAQWIACNAINQGVGGEFDNDVIVAYEWFMDPDGNPETVDDVPDVVQNSWRINEGFGGDYTDCDSRWWDAIDNCEASGCVTTWSAGNEGPGSTTIGSPPDRATTATNAFSVGAVDATNYGWPYPIAGFSSRGPTGCDVAPDLKTKPEVVAPGVDVYSSVPGGGYSGSYSGTSMAGPHVAGIVGLMRQANPNLDVDTIKLILMETARDEGDAGEDNTYGWGHVDAYAACVAATTGFGEIEGTVTNASWGNNPINGVRIRLIDMGNTWYTNNAGYYNGALPAGLHAVEASHPSFRADSSLVDIVADELTIQNFSLVDIAGPTITDVTDERTTTDTVGPYRIEARITDHSTVADATLYYRINGAGWSELSLTPYLHDFELCYCDIPGMPAGSQIDYYVRAEDGIGLTSTSPEGAPLNVYTLYITEVSYAYDAETPDAEWQLGAAGDLADTGIWILADPIGTEWNGSAVQPEDDHTEDPGVQCFITGNGTVGGAAGDQDVDHGCTTLLSPVFDLSEVTLAFVSYHRWFGQNGNAVDDEFAVDVSNDGGSSWQPLERVPGNDNAWRKMTFSINDIFETPDQVQFRFVACDEGNGGLVEAGIDDFAIETFTPILEDVTDGGVLRRTQLAQNEPNPFHPATTIRIQLSNPAHASLEIFDTSGRLVRTLVDQPMTAGTHQILWNGLDAQGREVGSGVYFYRLRAGVFEQCRRMTILR